MTKNSFVAEVTFKNRPIYFHIYSTRRIRLLKQKLTFPALKSTSLFLPQSAVSRRQDSSSKANSSCCYKSDALTNLQQNIVPSA